MFSSKYNPTSEVKDIHKGKRAIVCGSGPSLNEIDFSRISPDENIIFACNQAVTVMSRCDYFCMTDHAVPKNEFFEYGVDIASKVVTWGDFFNASKVKDLYKELKDRIYFFERDPGNLYDFSSDIMVEGVDVSHPTAHFAHITGCSEIILAGIDMRHRDNKTPDDPLNEELIYCNSTVYGKRVDWSGQVSRLPTLQLSFNNWKNIITNNEIKFFNVSEKSRLNELGVPLLPIESLYKTG